MPAPVLQARGISKSYGGVAALKAADFDVRAGAVNVLIGENGAGKSTLMRILAGVERPDGGSLLLDGQPVAFRSVRDAARNGIGIVFQELNLCPNLTVSQNVFLGHGVGPDRVILDEAKEREATREILERLDQTISPDALVAELPIGEQQIVEIAKALSEEARILILDEPTSALSASEVDALFRVIAELKRADVAIIYISHRLEELMRIGDYITVLRDGVVQASVQVAEASVPWIVEKMLGQRPRAATQARATELGPVVLSIRDLVVAGASGPAVDHVSAEFRTGQITAIYGLLGSGRTELLEAICGARKSSHGVVRLVDEDIGALDIAERMKRRLQFLPEDRQRDGLFHNLSVGGNLGVGRLGAFARLGAIIREREWSAVTDMISRLGVKTSTPDADIHGLSGGNQQKVVLGRCLMSDPLVVLLDEPSRGVDVGSRSEVFDAMRAMSDRHLAVIFATSDLNEAMLVADRVLVMAGGRITADLPIADATTAALVEAAGKGRSGKKAADPVLHEAID